MRAIKGLAGLSIAFLIGFMGYAIYDHKFGDGAFVAPTAANVLTDPDAEILEIMQVHRKALETEMSNTVEARIQESLQLIKQEYGEVSVQYVKAVSEASLMLVDSNRHDLGMPYMEQALIAARQVYGTDHRETALILNDIATFKIINSTKSFSADASPFLKEAITIRDKVMGPAHNSTYGARMTLADNLYLQWKSTGADPKSPLLTDGILVAKAAVKGMEQDKNANEMQLIGTGMLWARYAFAKEDIALAVEIFANYLPDPTSETTTQEQIVLFDVAYGEYIDALRQTNQDEIADKLIADITSLIGMPASAAEETAIDGPVEDPAQAEEE